MEPDAHPWDEEAQQFSPITRIAEHVVIWHSDDLRSVKHHDTRAARAMREHLSRYKRRFFVDDWEAGLCKIDMKFKVTNTESILSKWTCFGHAIHRHAFMEAEVSWYQPVRARQDDELVPGDALCIAQPFHPGVLNILYPYAPTLAKQWALKQRPLQKPVHGRYQSELNLAAGSSVPSVHGA